MTRYFSRALIIFAIVAVIFSIEAYGEGNKVFVVAHPDRPEVNVGDRINLTVDVENDSGHEVSFPEEPQDLGDFDLIESKEVKNRLGMVDRSKRIYVMSIYTTGTHVIPPIDIEIKSREDQKWQTLQSPQVTIEVKSVLTGQEKDIKDIKGLVFAKSSFNLLVFFIVLALLAAAVFFAWKKRREEDILKEEELLLPHELAYRRLNELKGMDLPAKGKVKEYYSLLSDIVREYLENRFSYRAPEMTTEEFLFFIKDSSELEKAHKVLLKDFLSHCDMVKFAKYGPTPIEMVDSFKSAEKLVDQTRLIEEEEEAADVPNS